MAAKILFGEVRMLKVSKTKLSIGILSFLSALIFYPPAGISVLAPSIMTLFKVPQLVLFFLALIYLVKFYRKVNAITIRILIYYVLTYILTAVVRKGKIEIWYPLCVVSLSILLPILYRKNEDTTIEGLIIYFELLCAVQIVCQILFPKGMFYAHKVGYQNWIIGFKNYPIRYLLPGAVLEMLRAYKKTGKYFVRRSVIYLAAMFYIVFTSRSATAYVGLTVFVIIIIISSIREMPKWLNIKFSILAVSIFFLLIYFAGFQIHLRYIIEQILSKDLGFTNRYVIWDASFNVIKENPIAGIGLLDNYTEYIFATHAHQYWLQILVTSGLIGFAFHLTIFLKADNILINAKNRKAASLYSAAIIAYLVMGIAEALAHSEMFLPLVAMSYESVRISYSRPDKPHRKYRFIRK